MIQFNEEIKKFKPCLEIDDVEEAINSSEFNDISDVFKELIQIVKCEATKETKTEMKVKIDKK